jgi:Matrixin
MSLRPGHAIRPLILPAVLLSALAVGPTPGLAQTATLTPATHAGHPRLVPGATLRADGVSFVIPEPGHTVWAAAEDVSGRWRSVGVRTAPDGTVSVVHDDGTVHVAGQAGSTGPRGGRGSACSDGAYTLYSGTWKSRLNWRFNASTTPSEINKDTATTGLRNAAENITHADNDCGLGDKVSATETYKGTTTKSPNMGTDGSCKGSDGTNVVAFGDLPSVDLAFTCWWTSGNTTVEADMQLNKVEYSWVVNIGNLCVNKFSVEAVATHEFGHAFGLGHVNEAQHPSLTMSPVIMPCQSSEKTLGLGDIDGLQAKY